MPVISDFPLPQGTDASVAVTMAPPVAIGGWSLQFTMMRRFGGSGVVIKSVASGYNGQSGITVTDSGQGMYAIRFNAADTSGVIGNQAYTTWRTDSGFATLINMGYVQVNPPATQ